MRIRYWSSDVCSSDRSHLPVSKKTILRRPSCAFRDREDRQESCEGVGMKKIAKRKAVRQRKSAKKETPVPSDKTDMDEFRDRLIKIQTETGLIKSHVSIALESQAKAIKSALIRDRKSPRLNCSH